MKLEKLIANTSEKSTCIKNKKLESPIQKTIINENKLYINIAFNLANRIIEKGLHTQTHIKFSELSETEKKAMKLIREESVRDRKHLKGDFVFSSILEIATKKKRLTRTPPKKRLQLNSRQIKQIFILKSRGTSLRKIGEYLKINRATVKKIITLEYQNSKDREFLFNIKKEINN